MGRDGILLVRRALAALFLTGITCLGLLAWGDQARAAWSDTYELNSSSDQGAESSNAAVDDAGNSAYIWLSTVDGALMMNQVGAGGEPNPGSPTAVTESGLSASTPDIVMNGEGDGLIVWDDSATDDILGSTFTAGGEPSAPFTVAEAETDWSLYEPKVAMAPDGDAYVTYVSQSTSGPSASEIGGVFVPNGGPPGSLDLLSEAGGFSNFPAIDAGGDNQFRVAWGEDDGTVHGATISSSGEAGLSAQWSQGTEGAQSPSIATNESGDSIVGYFQMTTPAAAQVVRVDADGSVGDPFQIGSSSLLITPPNVGIAQNGDAVASYTLLPGPAGIGVYAVDISASDTVSDPTLISAPGLAQGQIGVAANGDAFASINGAIVPDGDFVTGVNSKPAGGEWTGIEAVDPRIAASTWGMDTARSGQTVVGWNVFGTDPGDYNGAVGNRFASVASGPASVDFGSSNVGTAAAPKPVEIENSGGSPLKVSGVTVGGAAAGDFVAGTGCNDQTLAPGASCSVDVTFTPGAAGARTAELAIRSDSIGDPALIALTGTGQGVTPPPGTAKVKITKVQPKQAKVKRGKKKVFKISVKNTGDAAATGVKLCAQPNKSTKKKVSVKKCVTLGQVCAGKTKTAKFAVKVKRSKKARGKAPIPVKLSSGNAGKGSTKIVVKIPR